MGAAAFDERWLRLAIVIHECSTKAVLWVLDDAMCKKHSNLIGKPFEERLEQALTLDQALITRSLLPYQVPTVYPSSVVGKYEDFDIGIVRNLCRFYVGNVFWTSATSGLPSIEKLCSYDWTKSNPHALMVLLADFRNWTFHHTGSAPLSAVEFSQYWSDLCKILNGLNYDLTSVSNMELGPIDCGNVAVMETLRKVVEGAISTLRAELASKIEISEFEQRVDEQIKHLYDLLGKLKSEASTKGDVATLLEKFENMNTVLGSLARVPIGFHTMSFEERKRLARGACQCVNDAVIKCREEDIYGYPKRTSDVMVTPTFARCTCVDAPRCHTDYGMEDLPELSRHRVEPVQVHEMFNNGNIVVIRGLPGVGKSAFCRSILRDWEARRQWGLKYEFVFHISVPFLVHLHHSGSFSCSVVLAKLYPDVFRYITYEELQLFKYLVILDEIDECDMAKVCAPQRVEWPEEAIKQVIVSREKYDRLIVGRPNACNMVLKRLLKYFGYEFLEMLEFSTEQVEKFVEIVCMGKADYVWQRIIQNRSLLGLASLPTFADILCDVISNDQAILCETQTDIFVWAYAIFLRRHFEVSSDEDPILTFENMFTDNRSVQALLSLCKIVFNTLVKGRRYFKACEMVDLGSVFGTALLAKQDDILWFRQKGLMEFFASIYLFVRISEKPTKLDEKMLQEKHLRGVLPLLFGLLGATFSDSSDTPQIVGVFVRTLMKALNIKPLAENPLIQVSSYLYLTDVDLFLGLCYEFRNGHLLNSQSVSWDPFVILEAYYPHQLQHILFFLEHAGQRNILELMVHPSGAHSAAQLCRLAKILCDGKCYLDQLVLLYCEINEVMMGLLASAFSNVTSLELRSIRVSSSVCWEVFYQTLLRISNQEGKNKLLARKFRRLLFSRCDLREENSIFALIFPMINQIVLQSCLSDTSFWTSFSLRLRLDEGRRIQMLGLIDFDVDESMFADLAMVLCNMPGVHLEQIRATSDECWAIFLRQVREAHSFNNLALEYISISLCDLSEDLVRNISDVFCLIANVELLFGPWAGLNPSGRNALMSGRSVLPSGKPVITQAQRVSVRSSSLAELSRLRVFLPEPSIIEVERSGLCMSSLKEEKESASDSCVTRLMWKSSAYEDKSCIDVDQGKRKCNAGLESAYGTLSTSATSSQRWYESFSSSVLRANQRKSLRLKHFKLTDVCLTEEIMRILAPVFCLLPQVTVRCPYKTSYRTWSTLLEAVQAAAERNELVLKKLSIYGRTVPQGIIDVLKGYLPRDGLKNFSDVDNRSMMASMARVFGKEIPDYAL